MHFYDTSKSVDTIQGIRQEIENLRQELTDALERATYVGMTAQEAKIYDARRQRLTALIERLRELDCKEEAEPIA
jgi:hypothetical protein